MASGYSENPIGNTLNIQSKKLDNNLDNIDYDNLNSDDCIVLTLAVDYLRHINSLLEIILKDQQTTIGE